MMHESGNGGAADDPRAALAAFMTGERRMYLDALRAYAEEHDQVLYDGRWLESGEAARMHWRGRLKALLILVELTALAVLLLLGSFVIVSAMSVLIGI